MGVVIETDYPFASGHTLWLDEGTVKTGTVRWATRFNNRYRVGIELNKKYDKEFFIEEGIERYRTRRDDATDNFISRLEQIEKGCQPSVRNEEILQNIKKAIDDMMTLCEEFEKKAVYSKEELKKII